MSDGPVSTFTLLKQVTSRHDIVRSGANLSSRMVENLFWFGRYAERCDDIARLLRVALERLIGNVQADRDPEWTSILDLCGQLELLSVEPGREAEPMLIQAIMDDKQESTLASNLRHLFRIAFNLRERLSLDNWRTINRLLQDIGQGSGTKMTLGEAFDFLDRAVLALMTLAGFHLDGMTRDQGWRFLSLGRRIERLSFLCATLRHGLRSTEPTALEWLLELADSIITYRSRYMSRPERLPTVDLLLLDPDNPRSVIFQMTGIHDYVARLAEPYGPIGNNPLASTLRELQACDLDILLNNPAGIDKLGDLLARIGAGALQLSDNLAQRFFSHVATQHTVSL
jgi:uncharacterized alpha-E superfamily protein